MNKMNEHDKIIERIKALLAMGGDNSSPKEAAIAMQRARKLMDKYQINIAEARGIDVDIPCYEYDTKKKKTQRWLAGIIVSIAKYNDCIVKAKYSNERNIIYSFHGFKNDLIMCKFMTNYIKDTAIRLYNLDKKNGLIKGNRGRIDYLDGISNGIRKRMMRSYIERKNKINEESKTEFSLIELKNKKIKERFGDFQYLSKTIKIKDIDSYKKGINSSKEIHLNGFIEKS